METTGPQIDPAVGRRRPTPDDARRIAMEQYLDRRRVDMREIASRLAISRTTLYRWLGGREAVLDDLLGDLAGDAVRAARRQAAGSGRERVLSAAREFLEMSSGFEPARHLVLSEPVLAIRVITSPEGGVFRAVTAGLREEIATELTGWDPAWIADVAEAMAQVGLAYEWANLAARGEESIERTMKALSLVLREPA